MLFSMLGNHDYYAFDIKNMNRKKKRKNKIKKQYIIIVISLASRHTIARLYNKTVKGK